MRCKRLPCLYIMMYIFGYRRTIQSAVHKYAACIARKYSSCTLLILGFILLFYIGRNIVNILKTRKQLVPDQYVVDYIAANLKVMVKAGDNEITAKSVQISLSNTGYENITFGQWRIYFYSISLIVVHKTAGFQVGHVNGGLFFLSPIKDEFKGISAGSTLHLTLQQWSIARTDHFQNWYVASSTYGLSTPKIIESTKDETLSFVRPYKNQFQWKKGEFDTYNPYTPWERYTMNKAFKEAPAKGGIQVIPTPFSAKTFPNKTIVFDKTWVVVKQAPTSSDHVPVSHILAINLGLKEEPQETKQGKYIKFKTDESFSKEQYELKVDYSAKLVEITSSSGEGAFYGVQTLVSMLESSNTIPEMVIKDHPRFSYRGLMVDVARTFHKKETIKKLIDIMSQYKMNKLHMHLTDNDGWRIEIPSIPELTKYGSRRCHYFENDKCLIPNLGSGPYSETQGSGFYTVRDFREILQYAKERYVEVIPKIEVPGHAFAAIKAMQYREKDLQRFKGHQNRPSYTLSDDVSGIRAIQWWLGSSINPCLNSSYNFVEAVLTDLQVIYEGIQKLELVHVGGDEVPHGVWEESSVCQSLYRNHSVDHNTIKKMFLFTIANIAYKHGLKISVWDDGIFRDTTHVPYDVKDFKQKEVFVNAWKNVREARTGGQAIKFADLGYKVIHSMASHLYLDHPYEPDPEERGLYWATRYIDTYKIFGFMPMDIFANADFDSFGNKIDLNNMCGGPCPQTKAPNNYIGMEACVWSETIRNENQLFSMIFPRLLAFSERAWHAAEWETLKMPEERNNAKRRDFKRFVNIVGKKELSRLEHAGVQYRIPPPGLSFSVETRIAKFNTFYSGHKVMMSLGNDSSWNSVGTEIQIPKWVSDIHVYAISPILNRKSRTVSLHIT